MEEKITITENTDNHVADVPHNDVKIKIQPTVVQEKDKTFLVSCITFFFILIGVILLRLSFNFSLWSFLGEVGENALFYTLSQIFIMFVIPILVFSIYRKQKPINTFKQLGFKKINKKVLGLSAVTGVTAFVFNMFVGLIFSSLLIMIGYRFPTYSDPGLTGVAGLVFGLFFTAILPSVCEETTHRGMLLQGMRGKLGLKGALIFSSLFFALMHLNVAQFFFTFILGALMGFATVAAKSIWPAIIIHFCNNGIIQYITSAEEAGWLFGNFYTVVGNVINSIPFAFFFVLFAAAGLGYLLLKLIRAMVKHSNLDANTALELLKPMPKPKFTMWEGVFFYGIIVLGALVTIFTFVWGVL